MRNNNRKRTAFGLAAVAAVAAVVVLAMPAASTAQVAIVNVGPAGLQISPTVGYQSMVLTVSGRNVHLRRSFDAGSPTAFNFLDDQGNALADGFYRWELSYSGGPAAVRSLAAARRSGSRYSLARQSGSFTIANGAPVDAGLTEASRAPAAGGTFVSGDLTASGTKHFAVVDPEDSDRAIYYAALEGPEAGTYFRGAARTVDGSIAIELPEHFTKVTETEGLTVQLTPVGGWSQLFVAEMSPERLLIQDAEGRDVDFNFLIQGVRKGYGDYKVERAAASIDQ